MPPSIRSKDHAPVRAGLTIPRGRKRRWHRCCVVIARPPLEQTMQASLALRQSRKETGRMSKDVPPPITLALVRGVAITYIRSIYCQGGDRVIVAFRKWGNSLAVRIPKAFADAIKASDGKRVELTIKNGALVLQPVAKPRRKPRYSLDELLAGMTRDNVPQEVTWGPPRGNEVW
jgi:antitoxin MazE